MSRRTGLILCLLTAALFFGDALVGDRTVVPAGFLYRHAPWTDVNLETIQDPAQQLDQIYQFYPWAHYFKESVWKGEFPLWNPFNYLGTPFFANPQTALLFPLTWLHLIFPLSLSFTLIFISKLALGLVGMYLWLNAIGLRPVSSLLGAAVYTLSMHTVAGIAFPYSTVEVLFPWVLLAAKALCRGGTDEVRSGEGQAGSKVRQPSGLSLSSCPETSWKLAVRQPSGLSLSECPETSWKLAVRQPSGLSLARWQGQAGSLSYVLFVLVVSVVALAGQPQSVLPVCSAALLLAGLITRPLRVRPVLLMGSGFLLALLVTSAQWLATLGYLRESMVASGPRVIRSGYPYTLDTLVSLLVPDFFGSPIQGNYWGFPGYQDSIFYSSIAGLVLAVLGLWLGRRRAHLQYLFPLLLLLIGAGVIFAIPGIESLLDLPVFQLAKRNKFVFLGIFAIAQLAAIGIEELQREERRLAALTLAMAAVMPVSAALLFWHYSEFLSQLDPAGIAVRNGLICLGLLAATVVILLFVPGRWKAGLLVTLVLLDLSFFSWGLNPRGSREALYPQPEINQMLAGERPRIYGFQGAYTPNSNQVFGLQDVRGYDVMTPTRLFRYMQKIDPSLGNAYKWLMGFDPDEIGLNTRMRQIIGEFLENAEPEVIEYLETSSYWSVSAAQVRNPALFDLLQIRYLLTAGRAAPAGFELLRQTETMKLFERQDAVRVKAYSRWKRVNEEDSLEAVAVHQDPEEVLVEADLPSPADMDRGAIEITQLELKQGSARYQVETSVPVVFVEFERFSPGWEARLNGEDLVEVFPAFHVFRGVYLPAGRNELEFNYRPAGFRYGIWLSLLGLAIVGVLALASARARVRGPEA